MDEDEHTSVISILPLKALMWSTVSPPLFVSHKLAPAFINMAALMTSLAETDSNSAVLPDSEHEKKVS